MSRSALQGYPFLDWYTFPASGPMVNVSIPSSLNRNRGYHTCAVWVWVYMLCNGVGKGGRGYRSALKFKLSKLFTSRSS